MSVSNNLLLDRAVEFTQLFGKLQSTTSRGEKEYIIATFKKANPHLAGDLQYIFETLAGKHPIGFTLHPDTSAHIPTEWQTVQQAIEYLIAVSPKTQANIAQAEMKLGIICEFLAPIVNRTLRLGIADSQLSRDKTPMLAKKYTGDTRGHSGFAVTEKLDGNRCVAAYSDITGKWEFTSRSGKKLAVSFDMEGMSRDYIYDGEILSVQQTEWSMQRTNKILLGKNFTSMPTSKEAQLSFNETSGLINRKSENKTGLVYNIFDIIDNDLDYIRRRMVLHNQRPSSRDIRILPILYTGREADVIESLLQDITVYGGEGIMLNDIDALYINGRTDSLLKYKRVQTIDMRVIDVASGKGKYEGQVGALVCACDTEDGKHISCEVGTGLSDAQRDAWSVTPEAIIGKIVTVGYHEMTQANSVALSKYYSLRFPRLIAVRGDKNDTSEF